MSLGTDDFIMPVEPLEQERFKCQLIATARSLKKKKKNTASSAQPKVTQSANCYLSSMRRHRSTYHHRTIRPTDHHVVGTTATHAEHQPAPPHHSGRGKLAHGHTYDLRQTLDSRAGHTRSIYGSRGRPSTRDDGYLFGRDKPSHTRADDTSPTYL